MKKSAFGECMKSAACAVLLISFFILKQPEIVTAQASEKCSAGQTEPNWIILDCSPGFFTPHDVIRIYEREGKNNISESLQDQLNFTNSVWFFEVGAIEQASLIIDFHSESGTLMADIYDDGNGDGKVEYSLLDNKPVITENGGKWTIRIISREGWWFQDNKINYNLDLQVDGPIRGMFHYAETYGITNLIKVDGKIDYEIFVRDVNRDGRPDYEWRQSRLPLPEDPMISGQIRTEIISNTKGDEQPMNDYLFWPLLSRTASKYEKGTTSLPPIQVDWAKAKILYVSEFVSSHSHPGSFYLYSTERVKQDVLNNTDFENPIAFYDLANAADGFPDLSIRVGTTLPFRLLNGKYPNYINDIEYAWDQYHTQHWSYQVGLIGRQPIDEDIQFPEFTVKAVPPSNLENWVLSHNWDAATFVEVELPNYYTSEYVYEWVPYQGNNDLRNLYLTGVSNEPPTQDFNTIAEGFRGEVAFNFNDKPYLYFSPLDHKLHLLKAQMGIWNIDPATQLQYKSLGGKYIDQWIRLVDGKVTANIYQAGGNLVYADDTGVQIVQANIPSAVFTTLPPRNHDEWAQLGKDLEAGKANFAPDDFTAMVQQFNGPAISIEGASLLNYRLTSDGFRFILELQPGFQVRDGNLLDLRDATAGEYVVTYNGQFSLTRLTPVNPTLTIQAPKAVGGELVGVEVTGLNTGLEDGSNLKIAARAVNGSVSIDLGEKDWPALSNTPEQVTFSWQPLETGWWNLQAWVEDNSGNRQAETSSVIQVSEPSILLLSSDGGHRLLAFGVLLAFAGLLGVAVVAWYGKEKRS